MNDMMHIDMMGGAGVESHENRAKLEHDNRHAGETGHAGEAAPGATFPATGNPSKSEEPAEGVDKEPQSMNHDMHNMHGDNAAPVGNQAGPAPAQLNNAGTTKP